MITKWYEVTCDYCGNVLNHYIDIKSSDKELKDDGFYVKGHKHFCNITCYNNYINTKHDGKDVKHNR